MIPIIKNIRVIDEQGNEYEATYPKRAKGLIKNGRARFINDDVICLACPPNKINENKNLEDYKMDNDNKNIFNETMNGDYVFKSEAPENYTWEYALQHIDRIANDTTYINEAIEAIANTDEDQALAISTVIKAREETNQRLIDFYKGMFRELNPNKPHKKSDELLMGLINKKIESMDIEDTDMEDFADQVSKLNELLNNIIGE